VVYGHSAAGASSPMVTAPTPTVTADRYWLATTNTAAREPRSAGPNTTSSLGPSAPGSSETAPAAPVTSRQAPSSDRALQRRGRLPEHGVQRPPQPRAASGPVRGLLRPRSAVPARRTRCLRGHGPPVPPPLPDGPQPYCPARRPGHPATEGPRVRPRSDPG